MKKTAKQIMTASVVAAITISNMNSVLVHAAPSRRVTSVLPQAGFTYALGDNQVSLSTLQNSIDEEESSSGKGSSKKSGKSGSHGDSSTISKSVADKIELSSAVTDATPNASNITGSLLRDILNATGSASGDESGSDEQSQDDSEKQNVDNFVVAKVEGYVNIRDNPSETNTEKIGKLPNKALGTLLEEKDGWYKIKSGDVTGWVKAQYCIVGQEAAEYAEDVATQMGTVNTQEGVLKTRKEPGTDADVMGYVAPDEQVIILAEEEDSSGQKWYKISMEEGDVYICAEYVKPWLDYKVAESNDAEKKRLAEEKAKTDANKKAASKNTSDKAVGKDYKSAASYTTETSSIGSAVAEFAKQFVGNPYVYGGTSLTNGADCSGFVMSVYQNFGVSLPHSSSADRTQGAAVDGLANAQPGDIVCYSGHVAIYIGGGQIVHASTAKTGIKISNADYRKVLAVRRIL
ncbi:MULTISPECIES: C40 family peptidase [Butyrivibrio]|uniref:C40 family peptidase n=1 Tax=Butyrivibrio TaxID=830 RepID=UPI000405D293|nr:MULTISPECIES: C40 family peptidase [Butyrivibrio]